MKAVIQLGGQQFIVAEGDEVIVDRQNTDGKAAISLEPLMVFDDKSAKVGKPTVAGAAVKAEVTEAEAKGDKVKIMKFQSKKRVKTLTGHRQPQTKLVIKKITVK